MTEQIVILSTCASEKEAGQLAALLLDSRLAACVNVIPGCQSYFRWKDKIERGNEWLVLIKSSQELFPQVAAAIESMHSYEVPEIIALPIVEGSRNYLNWLRTSVGPEGDGQS